MRSIYLNGMNRMVSIKMLEASQLYSNNVPLIYKPMPEASQVYSKVVMYMMCDPEGVVDSMVRTFCYKALTPTVSFTNEFLFFYKAMTPTESFSGDIPIFYKPIIPLGLKN